MIATRKLEKLAGGGASACFGGAVAFAVYQGLAAIFGHALALEAATVAAACGCWLSWRFLAIFEPAITRVVADPPMPELLLEEVLVSSPNARVVRLFDPAALPVSRQSLALSGPLANDSSAAPPDASQDLREALNQLRRSLRQA